MVGNVVAMMDLVISMLDSGQGSGTEWVPLSD